MDTLLVAILDDEESFRTALGRLITSYGLNIATFEPGQTLLDSLPARQPNCVLLDFSMPGLNGMDVLRLLQTAGWKLPVIMVTGRDQPTLRAQCLAAGAMAYLQKPADPAEFLQAIGERLEGAPANRRCANSLSVNLSPRPTKAGPFHLQSGLLEEEKALPESDLAR